MRARSKALNARQLPNNVRPRSPDDACRGSQEVFFGSAVGGPASMYPAFGWSAYWLLATMDISAHAISLADRPQWAIWVTSVRMRREDRSSISFYPLADLGGKGWAISSRAPYLGLADFAATH